jgi:outer membrane protein assembly factor BamB
MYTLFCPSCHQYLGPVVSSCLCGWERTANEKWPISNQLHWKSAVDGPVRGRAEIVDGMVLFSWGNRASNSGIKALRCVDGTPAWGNPITPSGPIEAEMAITERYVLYGTLQREKAVLACHRLTDGGAIWQQPLSDSVWDKPLIMEKRVYVGCADGSVWGFELENGKPLANWPIQLSQGRMFLSWLNGDLIAASQTGQVFLLDPKSGRQRWPKPVELKAKIRCGPVVGSDRVFLGTTTGQVVEIDLRRQIPKCLIDHLEGVLATPVLKDNILYLGAADGYLHAYDIKKTAELWKRNLHNRIVSTPLVVNGTVFVGSNYEQSNDTGGQISGVDARSGGLVWQYPLKAHVINNPVYKDGVIYIGAEDGGVYALPWYLDRFDWAAQKYMEQGQFDEAGVFYAIAGWHAPANDPQAYSQQAIRCWLQSTHPEWAAYLQEYNPIADPAQIAAVYQQAGEVLSTEKPALAVNLLHRASEQHERGGNTFEAQNCRQLAYGLKKEPFLRVQSIKLHRQKDDNAPQLVIVAVSNDGNAPAKNLRLCLTGDIETPSWMDVDRVIYANGPVVKIEVPITAPCAGQVNVIVHYQDSEGSSFVAKYSFEAEEVPSQPENIQKAVAPMPKESERKAESPAFAIEYFDCDITITEAVGGVYPVSIRSSAGEIRGKMNSRPSWLEASFPANLQEGQKLGIELFDAIFTREIYSNYLRAYQQARDQGKGLRLRLHVIPPELELLPWELLYNPLEDKFIGKSQFTPIVRYPDVCQPVKPMAVSQLQILGVHIAPPSAPSLDLEREQRVITKALEALIERSQVSLTWQMVQNQQEFSRLLRSQPPHIIHIIGHAGFDKDRRQGYLYLPNQSGFQDVLFAENLGMLLEDKQSLQMVFLNTCSGAQGDPENAFASIAATLIKKGVQAVIGMSAAVEDHIAVILAGEFYKALATGAAVDTAVSIARQEAVLNDEYGKLSWALPVLFMRSPDGRLFKSNDAHSSSS